MLRPTIMVTWLPQLPHPRRETPPPAPAPAPRSHRWLRLVAPACRPRRSARHACGAAIATRTRSQLAPPRPRRPAPRPARRRGPTARAAGAATTGGAGQVTGGAVGGRWARAGPGGTRDAGEAIGTRPGCGPGRALGAQRQPAVMTGQADGGAGHTGGKANLHGWESMGRGGVGRGCCGCSRLVFT